MPDLVAAWCVTCQQLLGRPTDVAGAAAAGQVHAGVCGHPVELREWGDWTLVDRLAGEPTLPLWDGPAEG